MKPTVPGYTQDLRHAASLPPILIDACVENSKEAIIVADMRLPDAPLCFVNDAFVKITGYTKQQAIGRNCNYLQGSDRKQPEIEMIRQAIKASQPLEVTLRNYKSDGTLFYNSLRLIPAFDISGTLSHYVGFLEDVSAKHNDSEIIERLSLLDQITGLLNREAFTNRVRVTSEANSGGLVIVKLDVVRFHDINNGYGYRTGDKLLREVAKRLETTRAFAVGRMGANEFALAFHADTADQADQIAAATVQLVETPFLVGENVFSLRVSSGCAFSISTENCLDLIRKSGTALHRSKRSLSRATQGHSDDDDLDAIRRIKLTAELKQALSNNEFLLHFQPKVDLPSLSVVGAEALIRWRHPVLGLQPPGFFISHAEDVGLIGEIDEWCLRAASGFSKQFNLGRKEPIIISCNISGLELMEPGKIDRIKSICEIQNLSPELIILELTETVMVLSGGEAMDKLKEIRQAGFGLSIDDFGTGYSNLRYIEDLPFSEIKIDRSFVSDLHESRTKPIIVEALIKLGKEVDIDIVAEGIETERELAILRDLGCGYGQGYLFGRPVVAEDFIQRFRETQARPSF